MSGTGPAVIDDQTVVADGSAQVGQGPPPVERRASIRYPAVAVPAWVAWNDPLRPATTRTSPALLLDVSDRGAAVVVDELPPAESPAWISLARPVLEHGMRVRTVGVCQTKSGPHLLRVAFVGICPAEVLAGLIDV